MAASKCPECGRAAGITARFCKECGYRLVPEDPEGKKTEEAKPATPTPVAEKSLEAAVEKVLDDIEAAEVAASGAPAPISEASDEVSVPAGEASSDSRDESPPEYRPARFALEVMNGIDVGKMTEVHDEEVVAGADGACVLQLAKDERISRRHAAFWIEEGQLRVRDLGSTNGTVLSISGARTLVDGDKLVVGGTILRVKRVPEV